jgi:pilus assembly protein CpaF
MNEVLGLGVLETYLKDPMVSEVMINGSDVYYEREGRIFDAPRGFASPDEVRQVIERIIHPIGRRVDESSPLVDGRLPDGSRVNIVVPPIALDGPVITIRKFSRSIFSADALIENHSISRQMAEFFGLIVVHRLNVMITGRTSSGKTTLLNLISNFIPSGERIVTIEEMAELQLRQRHVVRLETRAPNVQGKGEITVRTLFRNALHMRPDRIIVGECRGAETLDMLQAMNTGHDGSISTAHSNSPRDLFARLEAMIGMSELSLNSRTVRKQIASGIDIVVYCTRYPDGQRKVTSLCEVQAGDEGGEEIELREIYRFDRLSSRDAERLEGRFLATGFVPSFVKKNPDLCEDPAVQALFS